MVNGIIKDKYFNPAIFIAGLILLILTVFYDLNIYDEGVGLTGAKMVLSGAVPYRDFWTMYAPGIFYFYALIFKLFGESIFLERLVSVIIIFGNSYLLFKITTLISKNRLSIIVYAVSIIMFCIFPLNARSIQPAYFFSLLSLYSVLKYLSNRKTISIIFVAVSNALVILFRHDTGFYLILVNLAAILTGILINDNNRIKKTLLHLLYFLTISLAVSFLPAFLLIKNAGHDFFSQLFEVPFYVYPLYRNLPFPTPYGTGLALAGLFFAFLKNSWETFAYFFAPVTLLVLILRIKKIPGLKRINTETLQVFTVAFLSLLLFIQTMVRSTSEHAMPATLLAVCLLIYLTVVKKLKKVYFVMVITFLLSFPIMKIMKIAGEEFSDRTVMNKSGVLKFIILDKTINTNYSDIVNYIKSNTKRSEMIFSCNLQNQKINKNNVIFYLLCDRMPCTKYYELHPGITTTTEVQKCVIEDLNRNKVNYIIISAEPYLAEPNLSGRNDGSSMLDDFIAMNYKKVMQSGYYLILKKISVSEQQSRPYVP